VSAALEPAGIPDVFSIVPAFAGGTIAVEFIGSADMRAKDVLDRFLAALHERLRSESARTVTVDLRRLEFMNSSCIKSFITWITLVQGLPRPEQYTLCFVSRPAFLWQKRSLHALRCFASDLVSVAA
jgi:hypothetical protein